MTSPRHIRLRSASRLLTAVGLALLVIFVILTAIGQTTTAIVAAMAVLPFVGAAVLLGGIVYGCAASFVADEQPIATPQQQYAYPPNPQYAPRPHQ